jgi:hypothetical protein
MGRFVRGVQFLGRGRPGPRRTSVVRKIPRCSVGESWDAEDFAVGKKDSDVEEASRDFEGQSDHGA